MSIKRAIFVDSHIKHLLLIFAVSALLSGCSQTYCAETKRYNPNTQKESQYIQTVGVKNDRVARLDWPNGGYSDASDFESGIIQDKSVVLREPSGIVYSVRLLQKGTDCYDGQEKVRCSGMTKKGKRCENMTVHKSGKCHFHRKQNEKTT